MGSVVLGTIDLTALCGCPDPCPDCCGTPIGCCPGQTISTTLHATVTSLANCDCGNGLVIPLTWSGSVAGDGSTSWTGTATFGTCTNTGLPNVMTVTLNCVAGANCAFELVASFSLCGDFTQSIPGTCTGCAGVGGPFLLQYAFLDVGQCCYDTGPMGIPPTPQSIQFTITL